MSMHIPAHKQTISQQLLREQEIKREEERNDWLDSLEQSVLNHERALDLNLPRVMPATLYVDALRILYSSGRR